MSTARFWVALGVGVLVTLLCQLLIIVSGLIPMAASGEADVLDSTGHLLWERSVSLRAPDASNPYPEAVADGFESYRSKCVHCHGAPGVDRAGWAEGMQPLLPSLSTEETRGRTDGELFHIIRHGIRMSGMPAFVDHDDEHLWKIVSFLRVLPELGDERRRRLQEAVGGHDHGDHAAAASEAGGGHTTESSDGHQHEHGDAH